MDAPAISNSLASQTAGVDPLILLATDLVARHFSTNKHLMAATAEAVALQVSQKSSVATNIVAQAAKLLVDDVEFDRLKRVREKEHKANKTLVERGVSVDELRKRFFYDPSTGELFLRTTGKVAKTYVNQHGYKTLSIRGKKFSVHRVVYAWYHGEWPNIVDHKNRIKNDNRAHNLRSVDNEENSQNVYRGSIPFPVWDGARRQNGTPKE